MRAELTRHRRHHPQLRTCRLRAPSSGSHRCRSARSRWPWQPVASHVVRPQSPTRPGRSAKCAAPASAGTCRAAVDHSAAAAGDINTFLGHFRDDHALQVLEVHTTGMTGMLPERCGARHQFNKLVRLSLDDMKISGHISDCLMKVQALTIARTNIHEALPATPADSQMRRLTLVQVNPPPCSHAPGPLPRRGQKQGLQSRHVQHCRPAARVWHGCSRAACPPCDHSRPSGQDLPAPRVSGVPAPGSLFWRRLVPHACPAVVGIPRLAAGAGAALACDRTRRLPRPRPPLALRHRGCWRPWCGACGAVRPRR